MAILQLARVVESKTLTFVKAHLLLALLYMAREDFNKGRALPVQEFSRLTRANQKGPLYYMSIVKTEYRQG